MQKIIHPARIRPLNKDDINERGDYVLYWMQSSLRTKDNLALLHALQYCASLKKPLLIYFGLDCHYPHANARSFNFLLQGLHDIYLECKKQKIHFVIKMTSPPEGVIQLSNNASILITDCGILRHQRRWRDQVARELSIKMVEVESNLVIPVWATSNKEEYAARTIRKKIMTRLNEFAVSQYKIPWKWGKGELPKMIKSDIDFKIPIEQLLKSMPIDHSVSPIMEKCGGERAAYKNLQFFIKKKLSQYESQRSDPSLGMTSGLSSYLHFGNISPLTILRELSSYKAEGFIEELIVRRELAFNMVWYNSYYDSYRILPLWAHESLEREKNSKREYLYSRLQFEKAKTHDPYWNAAQKQMTASGFMHGYMRMYWGKKIIEWSKTPEEAFKTMLYLNDKYQLDGRDPNGYCGIAWCFGKHDRPWTKRPIFGSVRYMNAKGLERKFMMKDYLEQVSTYKRS